jgi:hypothetical protein
MNFGTKLRTIARIVASLNTAVYAVSASVAGLGFGKLTLLWTILTIIVDFGVAFVTTYYNNDYTPEGQTGTMLTREMKENRFNNKYVEEPGDSEVDDDDE